MVVIIRTETWMKSVLRYRMARRTQMCDEHKGTMVGKNARSAKFFRFYKQNGTFWKHLHFTILKKIKVYITIHRTCFIHISQKILPLFHISQCFSGGIHNSQDKSWSQFHSFFCSISQNHKPREAISQFTKTVSPPGLMTRGGLLEGI